MASRSEYKTKIAIWTSILLVFVVVAAITPSPKNEENRAIKRIVPFKENRAIHAIKLITNKIQLNYEN